MKAIITEVGRVRAAAGGGKMIVESSPVGQSQSNGVAERAISSVEGQLRVLRDALEARLNVKLPVNHPLTPWLVEYAALVLNRFEVGKEGKTAHERSKGKNGKLMGLEFGEAVLWKRRPEEGHLGKLTCLWSDGIHLGVKGSTGEIAVGNKEGIWKTRAVQRKPKEMRRSSENADMVK